MRPSLSRVVIPSLIGELCDTGPSIIVPSTLTLEISPQFVWGPQTGHTWHVEFNADMTITNIYSLIPVPGNMNRFTNHFWVETQQPRLLGDPILNSVSDAWLTTQHYVMEYDKDVEIHSSKTFFSPRRADDKLYFDSEPFRRVEILARNRFIEDREILRLLDSVLPEGQYDIAALVECRT